MTSSSPRARDRNRWQFIIPWRHASVAAVERTVRFKLRFVTVYAVRLAPYKLSYLLTYLLLFVDV